MGRFEVGPAPLPTAGPGEVVLKVRAVAMNPVDAITGPLRRIVTPWGRYPTVIGSDVAGEIVEIGQEVTRLRPGDRVLGYAAGQERARNTPAEGGFQRYVVVLARVCTAIPDHVAFETPRWCRSGSRQRRPDCSSPTRSVSLTPGPWRNRVMTWRSSGAPQPASGATPWNSRGPADTPCSPPRAPRTTSMSARSGPRRSSTTANQMSTTRSSPPSVIAPWPEPWPSGRAP
ncbi:alcohol dehydrogenase catalytic domain-containing protein [Lapillicoccus sp.]|uniref:alcohol dehydrogenase catalytic domain-containing protein n=1 Tax=Lapillicoccus sp. TaxID=1909287 RepID=UPI003450E5BF